MELFSMLFGGGILMSPSNTTVTLLKNTIKLLIDIPFYIFIIITSVFQSLLSLARPRKRLDSKDKILVTGAASGIGQHAVYRLATLFPEAVFILWDINEKALEETAAKCRQECGAHSVHTFVVDLSRREEVVKNAALVRQAVGKVTLLWNNAGITTYSTFLEGDPELEEKILKVNLLSYMWTIREFLPDMVEEGKGHLVTTCSALSFYRWSHLSSYIASKYGLRGFMDTLKLEISQHPKKPDIKFSTFYPAFVNTPMTHGATWEPRYEFAGMVPMELEQVADEFVDGILRAKEDVRIPWHLMGACDVLYRLLPSKCFEYWDKNAYRNIKISKLPGLTGMKMQKASLNNTDFMDMKSASLIMNRCEGKREGSG